MNEDSLLTRSCQIRLFFSVLFISSLEGKKSWNVCDHYSTTGAEWMHALGFAFSKVSCAGSGSLPLSDFWILRSSKCFPTINLCWTIKFNVQCQQREGSAFRNQRKEKNISHATTYFIIYLIIVKQASTQLFTSYLSVCIQWLFHCLICCRTKSLIRFLCVDVSSAYQHFWWSFLCELCEFLLK